LFCDGIFISLFAFFFFFARLFFFRRIFEKIKYTCAPAAVAAVAASATAVGPAVPFFTRSSASAGEGSAREVCATTSVGFGDCRRSGGVGVCDGVRYSRPVQPKYSSRRHVQGILLSFSLLRAPCAVWRARVPPLAARFSPSDSFATMFS
jgi:hypothetical protein